MANHARAGHTVGVADGNGATVDVEVLVRNAEGVATVEHLNGKRFVELPEPDVIHGQAVFLEQLRHGIHRTDTHFVRIGAGNRNAAVCAERLQADLILTGSLDFDVQDRSGYRTEAYTSPYDGRTYYRQVLVEETGFEFDIVMQVYDGRTGRLLYNDNFKDFKRFEGERTDPLTGMFENLYALESRIAGIFVQKRVETNRVLFTQ